MALAFPDAQSSPHEDEARVTDTCDLIQWESLSMPDRSRVLANVRIRLMHIIY